MGNCCCKTFLSISTYHYYGDREAELLMRSRKLEFTKRRFADQPMSNSPNAGRVLSEFDPRESTSCCNEPSLPLARAFHSVPYESFWQLVNYHHLLNLRRELTVHLAKLLPATAAGQQTACIDIVNKEKTPTSVGLVDCAVGSGSCLLGDSLSPYEEPKPTVVNFLDQRSNNPGSNDAPAITFSEKTDHIPMEHDLTENELQHRRSSSWSGKFTLQPIQSTINYISNTLMDVIFCVFNSSVTSSANGGTDMEISCPVIHMKNCFRRIHSAFNLDHLPTTRIYMTRNRTDEEFILDSGAEDHVTGNFALLSRVTAVENGHGIQSVSEHFMPALCSGSLIIDRFKVIDVLFVRGMIGTIFSVSKLDDLGYSTEFIGRECFVRDVRTRDLVGKGHRANGLYKLDYLEIPLDRARVAQRPAPLTPLR